MKDKAITFVETLLRSQRTMKAERIGLNIKWGILERQKDNAIEGQFLSAQYLSDMPGIPKGGYKDSPLMLVHNKEYDEIKNEQSFIVARLKDIDDILCAIDASLQTLTNTQRLILHYYYTEGYSREKIAQTIYMYPDNVSKAKTAALETLWESLKVLEGTVIFKSA